MKLLFHTWTWRRRRLYLVDKRTRQKARFISKQLQTGDGELSTGKHLPVKHPLARPISVKVPPIFDLISNRSEVNTFLSQLRGAMTHFPSVFVDASQMQHVSIDASLCLQALIHSDPGQNKCKVSGNYPTVDSVRTNWIDTGFFEHLEAKQTRVKTVGNMIVCSGDEQDTTNVRVALSRAVADISGVELALGSNTDKQLMQIVTTINKVCIDLRLNVLEYAANGGNVKPKWWIAVQPDILTGRLLICIADAGVGIMKSVNVKRWKFRSTVGENVDRFGAAIARNHQVLRKAIAGHYRFSFSATDKKHRGNGLRSIGALSREKFISSIYVITNDVFGNLKSDIFEVLRPQMIGTVYIIETNDLRQGDPNE